MANVQPKSGCFKLAFIILVLCLVLHLVGFITPSWNVISFFGTHRSGLWKSCFEFVRACVNTGVSDDQTFLVVQALESLGLAFLALATLTTFALLCCTANVCLERLKLVFTLFAGLVIEGGAAWFIVFYGVHNLGYSYMLCSAAGSGCIIAFIIFCCCDKAPPAEQQQGYVLQSGAPPNEGQQGYVMQPGAPPTGQYPPQGGYAQQPAYGQQPLGYNGQQQALYPQVQSYQQQADPSAPPPTYNLLEKGDGL